jgi:hypothetical protein
MRFMKLALLIVLFVGLGCGTPSGGRDTAGKASSGAKSPDGLVEVEIDGPGHLFLRKEHGIGGYDAIAVAQSFVTYRRSSARIDPDEEEVYLASLEQAVIDVAEAANVPIADTLGKCVIKVGAGFVNVQLADSDKADVLGRMTLVIEYRDSVSGQSLLRYYAEQYINRESGGMSREQQIGDSFDRMIEGVNIIATLRAATAVPSLPKAGCNGSLVNSGLAAESS